MRGVFGLLLIAGGSFVLWAVLTGKFPKDTGGATL